MDRSWMYENRTTFKYVQGVQEFIQYAEENRSKKAEDYIVCPCCDCKNLRRYRNSDEVKAHLIRRGFKEGYNRWIWHGESLLPSTSIASIPSTSARVFGRPDRKQSTSSGIFTADAVKNMMDKCREDTIMEIEEKMKPKMEKCRQDTIMEMEAKMKPKIDSMDQQLKFLMKNISGTHLFSQGVSVGTPRSSCHSVDTYPVTTIKSPKRCSLAVCPDVGVTPTVVAKGMVHPNTDGVMVHNQPLLLNCVKVWVDEVVDGAEQFNLPMPTLEYATIAHIVGNFVQWPMHLVFLDEVYILIFSY
nr:uncharacterized protein LOC109152007 [Ipomoea batatas]